MNITAYAEETEIQWLAGQYLVIDAAQSVGKKYPVVIGTATIIRGFIHYVGDNYSAHKGVKAIFKGNMAEGPNYPETIQRVLQEGLANGRDDSK